MEREGALKEGLLKSQNKLQKSFESIIDKYAKLPLNDENDPGFYLENLSSEYLNSGSFEGSNDEFEEDESSFPLLFSEDEDEEIDENNIASSSLLPYIVESGDELSEIEQSQLYEIYLQRLQNTIKTIENYKFILYR